MQNFHIDQFEFEKKASGRIYAKPALKRTPVDMFLYVLRFVNLVIMLMMLSIAIMMMRRRMVMITL